MEAVPARTVEGLRVKERLIAWAWNSVEEALGQETLATTERLTVGLLRELLTEASCPCGSPVL